LHKVALILFLAWLLAILAPSSGMAQGTNYSFLTNVSGGYAYASGHLSAGTLGLVQPVILPDRGSFNGWDAQFGVKLSRVIGITVDVSGVYGSQQNLDAMCFPRLVPICVPDVLYANGSLFTFVAGPRFAFKLRKFTPFAEALVGAALAKDTFRFTATTQVGTSTPATCPPVCWDASFADSLGGGIAYRLSQRLDIYLRGDLLQTHLPTATAIPFVEKRTLNNNVQLSAGVSYRFCAFHNCRSDNNRQNARH
jgi:hypothetical protein